MAALNQAWRRTIMLLAALLIVLSLSLFYFPVPLPEKLQNAIPFKNFTPRPSPFHDNDLSNSNLDLSSVGAIIQALWAPLLLPITEKTFVGVDGAKYNLAGEPIFKKKLGKNLCILDVDTRQLDEEGEVFNPQTPSWDNLKRLSAGILSHYMYALIHGYDYKFVRAPDYEDRQGGWTKVIMTQELLKTHDYVLMIDEDAELRYPYMPLEWLMNYWNITPEVSIAMAEDPNGEPNYDSKGKVMLNTGFVINQAKAPKTQEIYKVWAECPEEEIFKGCARWKREGFREQTAFSEFVRYNYQEGNVIKVLPCNEANGAPEAQDSGCTGQLVRHYWVNKDLPKREFSDGVMQGMVPLLHAGFGNQIMDLRNKKLKGNLILD